MARYGFLNRSASRTQGEASRVYPNRQTADTEDRKLITSKLDKGINIALDPLDIELDFLSYGLNGRIRDGQLQRRAGYNSTSSFATKPDSNRIVGFGTTKRFDGTQRYIRYTPSTIHIASGASSWTALTGSALGGGVNDRFQQIVVQNRIFFHNNGVLPLQEINVAGNSYAQIGNSKRYKWYVPIYNRIVGLNLVGASPNPIEIGGCGDLNYSEWDPNVDLTAFADPVLDSQGGYGDFIYWGANLNDRLLILRERSIWLGTPQPISSRPFRWQQLIPDFGSSLTYSAQVIPGGAIWYDLRRESFYLYRLGDTLPTDIGTVLGGEITTQLSDVESCWSTFDPFNWEYKFGFIPAGSNITKIYVYNLLNNTWMLDEITNCSGIFNGTIPVNLNVIDSLTGTINSLSGTIDSLSGSGARGQNVAGLTTGELLSESIVGKIPTNYNDNNVAFVSDWRSKLFEFPATDMYVNTLEFEYTYSGVGGGTFTIEYSTDGGTTFNVLRTITIPIITSSTNTRKFVRASKNIKCRNFMWRVVTDSIVDFKLLEATLNIQTGGIKFR